MNSKTIYRLNKLYDKTLAKPKWRKRLNNFLYGFLWKLAFKISCLKKTDEKLVLFVANCDYKMPKDFQSLYDYAKKCGYKCQCLYKFKGGSPIIFKNELSKIKSDLVFQKYYARAKITFLDEYYLPAYANKPRKGTRLVQLWHGCGAFKRFSYSIKDSSWGLESELFEKYHVHKTYTDIIASSEDIVPVYNEAFDAADGIVKALGVPRTDVYFDGKFVSEQRENLVKKYPLLSGKKIVLWAPTLRGNNVESSYTQKAIDFLKLKNNLGEDYVLLIKLHPRISDSLSFSDEEKAQLSSFVIDISKDVDIDTALCASDIVITDYSSLIFEYALLNRPMIFYAYDLEEYEDQRSFYYDYQSFVPGKIVKNTDELSEAVITAEKDFDEDKIDRFKEKFMSACDGKSTQRVFDFVSS
ncbi:MAG: CDP-glycerol glycerophosphotransferase family protein [Acutalibacteraceae bacterium]